jgi:class III poly(R)-hydroxyalkanoic acid synthase PhaC subunit
MNPLNKAASGGLPPEHIWRAILDAEVSSYTFCSKLAGAVWDATAALNRGLVESYVSSDDFVTAEKKALALARTVFEDRFDDPEFLASLARAVNDFSKWAKLSGYAILYQTLSSLSSLWNNTYVEPVRDSIGRTPFSKTHSDGNFSLFHYDRQVKSEVQRNPILVVYAFINRHYILDLLPDLSVVRNLLGQGFDIYATDWATPGAYDRELTINHYVNNYLDHAVDHVRKRSSRKVTILGYCWGGDLALMYASLHPEKVANVVTLATPGDFSLDNSILAKWTRAIDADALVDAFGNAPSAMLNAAFLARSPIDFFHKYPHFFERPRELEAIKQFLATEMWLYDSPPVAGEIFRQFVNDCYKSNLLILNKMELAKGQLIDLRKMTMPYLNVIASNDDLVAPASSRTINNAIGSTDKTSLEFKSGHVGLCTSSAAHNELWPRVGSWLKEQS